MHGWSVEEVKSFKAANYELGPDSISALASTPAGERRGAHEVETVARAAAQLGARVRGREQSRSPHDLGRRLSMHNKDFRSSCFHAVA